MYKSFYLRYFFLLTVFSFGIENALLAQTPVTDSLYVASYRQLRTYFPEIHTGSQYARSQPWVAGHPYFGSSAMEYGKLTIQDFEFSHVPLQYDLFDEILVTLTPARGQRTIMNPQRIRSFELADGSRFVKKEKVEGFFFHRSGFYREIATGNQNLYCKHYKEVTKDSSPLNPFISYAEVKRYFIEIDETMYGIRNKKDAYRLLSLNRKDVRGKLKESRLKFKRDREAYLLVLINFANSSTN